MSKVLTLLLTGVMVFSLSVCDGRDTPGDTGMPDPALLEHQESIKKVNTTYGTDEILLTLYKPDKAYFSGNTPLLLKTGKTVVVKAENSTWRAEIFGAVCYDDETDTLPFVDYYYNGSLREVNNNYEFFNQTVTDLNIDYLNKPVKLIQSDFKKADAEKTTEYFVGFEFDNTKNGEAYGKGLMGFKFYSFNAEHSKKFVCGLFKQLFYVER